LDAEGMETADVYMLNAKYLTAFTCSMLDLITMEDIPLFTDSSTPTSLEIVNGDVFTASLGPCEERPKEFAYASLSYWFMQTEEGYEPADGTTIDTITAELSSLVPLKIEAYMPTEAELAEYGITGDVSIALAFKTYGTDDDGNETVKEYSYKVLIGNEFERDGVKVRYIMSEGGDQVLSVPAECFTTALSVGRYDLLPQSVGQFLRSEVDKIDITTANGRYAIEIIPTTVVNNSGNEVKSYIYKINGKEVDTEAFTNWYLIFSGMRAESSTTDELEDTPPLLTMVFHRNMNDGFDKMTLEIRQYDSQFYRVSFGGYDYQLVNRREVDTFIEKLAELVK